MSEKLITMGAFGTYSEMENRFLIRESTRTLTPYYLRQVRVYQAFPFTRKQENKPDVPAVHPDIFQKTWPFVRMTPGHFEEGVKPKYHLAH